MERSPTCLKCGADDWFYRKNGPKAGQRACKACRRARNPGARPLSDECKSCGASDWYVDPSGHRACRLCRQRLSAARYRDNEDFRERRRTLYKTWSAENIERSLWRSAKGRADKRGLAFDLVIEDIVIPEFCPVLGLRLQPGTEKQKASSPTLDRFDNSRGYTKDNVRVISWRANTLKNDATAEELKAVLRYMQPEGTKAEPQVE